MTAAHLWEQVTGLDLESVTYKTMWVRDVNNYMALKEDGELKRKGAYRIEEDLEWHQNASAMVVPMAVQAHLVHGADYSSFIRNHRDPMDFMIRAKVRRVDRIEWGDQVLQRITRYFVSNGGHPLFKIMPPLKGKVEPRRNSITKGYLVTPANDMRLTNTGDINYDYYIAEAKKLIKPLTRPSK